MAVRRKNASTEQLCEFARHLDVDVKDLFVSSK